VQPINMQKYFVVIDHTPAVNALISKTSFISS